MAKLKKAAGREYPWCGRRLCHTWRFGQYFRRDILRALEGSLEAVTCAAFHEDESCEAQDICATKYVWKRINESIRTTVDGIYLAQLVEESRKNKAKCHRQISPEALCGGSRKETGKEENHE
mgnify:CR=1 FL=1